MTAPTGSIIATKEDVQAFADSCVFLRSQWIHFTTLFEGSDLKRELLQATAPTFFRDLDALFIEHFVLHICRLTDGAQTMGRKNLTENSFWRTLIGRARRVRLRGSSPSATRFIASASASFRRANGSSLILIFPPCGKINRSARRRTGNGSNFGSTYRTSSN